MLSLRNVWVAGLFFGSAKGFVPPSLRYVTTNDAFGGNVVGANENAASEVPRARSSSSVATRVWGWFDGKKNEEKAGANNDLDGKDVIDVTSSTSSSARRTVFDEETDYDVVIVGAGSAGVGTALTLTRTFGLDADRVVMVEKAGAVGDSFRRWPAEMRFISPSFNQQGWTRSFDLNAIHHEASPSQLLRSEHPTGREYASYLDAVVRQFDLNVRLDTRVASVRDAGSDKKKRKHAGPFHVEVAGLNDEGDPVTETFSTRYVVWAAGEFQYPRETHVAAAEEGESEGDDEKKKPALFPGADHCLHNSRVESWNKLPGDDFVVIGGYESGMDAVYHLAKAGKRCKVLASTPCWLVNSQDPSMELAPYTASRLREILARNFEPKPALLSPIEVIAVDEVPDGGGYDVAARWRNANEQTDWAEEPKNDDAASAAGGIDGADVMVVRTPQRPVLCTGFEGSAAVQASHLFDFPAEAKGCLGNGPVLTRNDESTRVRGVYLVGPSVVHGQLSFCFVYKFRQRFAVVANAICTGLGMDTTRAVAECRGADMYLDDFATCEGQCSELC